MLKYLFLIGNLMSISSCNSSNRSSSPPIGALSDGSSPLSPSNTHAVTTAAESFFSLPIEWLKSSTGAGLEVDYRARMFLDIEGFKRAKVSSIGPSAADPNDQLITENKGADASEIKQRSELVGASAPLFTTERLLDSEAKLKGIQDILKMLSTYYTVDVMEQLNQPRTPVEAAQEEANAKAWSGLLEGLGVGFDHGADQQVMTSSKIIILARNTASGEIEAATLCGISEEKEDPHLYLHWLATHPKNLYGKGVRGAATSVLVDALFLCRRWNLGGLRLELDDDAVGFWSKLEDLYNEAELAAVEESDEKESCDEAAAIEESDEDENCSDEGNLLNLSSKGPGFKAFITKYGTRSLPRLALPDAERVKNDGHVDDLL